ncbi:DUF2637 domain-containing protein [Rhodococcus hoagii]|uniref:DUF2637 domain-containing protein n=1 Tax=Rhodococcus hoagii TaxID=43767 RepID=UPI00198098DF|nr:DUF2637 domain-containing protein [Prescottella equi]MBM4512246.1 DUF2637 domain-containing protein [Prescottella equi]MBM4512547.1 DUF2637 domain-containing protein [Prescottella equi]MBM4548568.1 DUF2637 domain-containing protein [Prescottella equi]MBM4708724.1 DUF2637 domain-containing protein [Prescottella equi]MBM4710937.1 DUF2637 domain-containing protein [Prescottella equi]
MTRHLPAAATYGIAVLAFALSYSNLAALAGRAGYGPVMAHVWPLVVDGLAVVATAAVMRLRASRVYAWSLLAAATAVSIVAGAAAHLLPAGPLPGWAGAAVAVVPPLCLLVAPHLAVQLRRNAADASTADVLVVEAVTHRDVATPVKSATAAAPVTAARDNGADQDRRIATQPDALFDVPAPDDAPAPMTRDEMKAEALHLLATTNMSQRAVAARLGTSEASVRRWRKEGDAADATPALAAVGG